MTVDSCLGNPGVVAGMTNSVAAGSGAADGSGAAEKRFSGSGVLPMDDPAAL